MTSNRNRGGLSSARLIGLLLVFAGGNLCAQEVPVSAGQVLPRLNEWREPDLGGPAYEVPPVSDRALGITSGPRTIVTGFEILGVNEQPRLGITQTSVQAVVDDAFSALRQGDEPAPGAGRFGADFYAAFAGVATGEPSEFAGQSLADVADAFVPLEEGESTADYAGLSAREVSELDNLFLGLKEGQGLQQAATITIDQLIQRLRIERYRLTVGQMQWVADRLTNFYRERGLFVAQAFVPAQTLTDEATVQLAVLEGSLGRVVVEGNTLFSPDTVARYARRLQGQAVEKNAIESALLRINDTPGLRVFGTFRAGEQVGETDLVLQVLDETGYSASGAVDNYGTDVTGEIRARGDGQWMNPLGLGDAFGMAAVQSVSPANNRFVRANYGVPLGAAGWELSLGASLNQFKLNEDQFAILDLDGETVIASLGLNWRFLRSRFRNSRVGVEVINETSTLDNPDNGITVNDDAIQKGRLSFSYDRVDTRFNGIDVIDVFVAGGSREFINAAGTLEDQSFSQYGLSYSRLQVITDGHSLLFRARGQNASDPLASLEQFSLAGPDAVRGFSVAEVLSDEGYFGSLEYRMSGPNAEGPFGVNWKDFLRLSVFGDYAYGKNVNVEASQVLSGAGVGARFAVPGRFESQLQVSTPLSSFNEAQRDEVQVYGEVSLRF